MIETAKPYAITRKAPPSCAYAAFWVALVKVSASFGIFDGERGALKKEGGVLGRLCNEQRRFAFVNDHVTGVWCPTSRLPKQSNAFIGEARSFGGPSFVLDHLGDDGDDTKPSTKRLCTSGS